FSQNNLGNSLFRQAESTKDPKEAVVLMKQSLRYYKDALNGIKRNKRSIISSEKDIDYKFNYTVVREKINRLMELIKQKENNLNNQKNIYVIVNEIINSEKQIKLDLASLKSDNLSFEQKKVKEQLVKQRDQNIVKLALIKEKLKSMQNKKKVSP
ncbi:MAG: tetratricopeptide repeat protein, partial [Flavobacteriaceae bacterium]|nr:tetratricopeptide repeat protein [Flavobacteriaceae bacterium]